MSEEQQIVPVFFTIDEGYAPYAAAAISSIIANSSKDRQYRLVVMHEDLKPETQERIAALAQPGFAIDFMPMELGYEGLSDRMGNRLRADYFTLTIFFRMFIPELFPEYDKVVYIDSDVVVPGDIAELYDTELGTNLIGACRDLSIWGIPEFVRYVEEADGVPIEDYLNSGILVMNAKELRNAHLVERFLELLNKYQFDSIAPDQDYFNVLCNGRITYLDPSWDVMPAEGSEDFPNPNLIHYNLFSKPWCYDNIQYEDYFWPYAEACGFIEEIRAHKANYSDEQKASDSAALGRMLERGLEIIDNEVTFKSVFNTGKEARL